MPTKKPNPFAKGKKEDPKKGGKKAFVPFKKK